MVQKLLIHESRRPHKRAQGAGLLYIHDTLELFGGALEALRAVWRDEVRPSIHPCRTGRHGEPKRGRAICSRQSRTTSERPHAFQRLGGSPRRTCVPPVSTVWSRFSAAKLLTGRFVEQPDGRAARQPDVRWSHGELNSRVGNVCTVSASEGVHPSRGNALTPVSERSNAATPERLKSGHSR